VFGVVTAIVVSGPMQFMSKRDLRELDHTLPQQFLANIYALLAIVYIGWAVVRSFTSPRSWTYPRN
jgi:hypothetical protein